MRLPALPLVGLLVCASAATAQPARLDSTPPDTVLAAGIETDASATTAVEAAAAPTGVAPLLLDPALVLPLDQQPVPAPTAPAPALAFEYSEGYRTRAKIHRIASFATLPLFGAEAIVGQSLYSDPSQNKRDAHLAIAGGLGALFAVNTVTGVWNLVEARKDPHFGKRKWAHALMMLGADAGFVATAALAPESENGEPGDSRAAHRAVAFTSIALATTSYLIMLFGN